MTIKKYLSDAEVTERMADLDADFDERARERTERDSGHDSSPVHHRSGTTSANVAPDVALILVENYTWPRYISQT